MFCHSKIKKQKKNKCRVALFSTRDIACLYERGAISIFMALFLASSLLLFNVLNSLVEYRLFQVRVQAATISQSEQILASFDRKLLERYGLFAYDSSFINSEVFYEEVNCSRKNMDSNLEAKEEKSLFELEELRKQIMLFSKPRIPIKSANLIWDRIKNLLAGKENSKLPVPIEATGEKYPEGLFSPSKSKEIPSLNEIEKMSAPIDEKVSYTAVDIKDSSLDLLDYLKKSKDFYENRDRLGEDINSEDDSDESEPDKNKKSISSKIDKVNSALQDFFVKEDLNRNLASEILGDIDTSSPEIIIGEAGKLFDILNQSSIPLYDSWCLNEYIVNQCSSSVRNSEKSLIDTSLNENITLRGDSFNSLTFNSSFETEEIITGLEGKKAALLVKFYIFLIRFLIRGVEVKNDRFKMASYNTIGAVISFVSSLSSVPIPKEAVVASLVFINSSTLALKDLLNLAKGKCIKLLASKNYKIDYIDHLRLFLIFVSDDLKLSRLGEKIKSNTKDNLYTAVSITSNWTSSFGTKQFSISNEYRFNLAEGAIE